MTSHLTIILSSTTLFEKLALASSFIWFLYYVAYFMELLARKEFRLDRFLAHIQDTGLAKTFFAGLVFKKPKILHLRNIMIFLIVLIVTIAGHILLVSNWRVSLYFFIFAPITALVLVTLGVVATALPVMVYRNVLITLATLRIREFKPIVIGITGSYGKTTTKSYIAHILGTKFGVVETKKNTNTDIGIAMTILKQIKSEGVIFVVEMGAYRSGEINSICKMVSPQIGVITAFGTQHSGLFGGKDNIIRAKSELGLALPKMGTLYLTKISLDSIPSDITSRIKAHIVTYKHILSDPHNQAIQTATTVSSGFGLTYSEIQLAISTIDKPKELTSTLSRAGAHMILSPYSTNSESFISHITMIKAMKKVRNIIYTPGIIELGSDKIPEYERIVDNLDESFELYTSDKSFRNVCKKRHIKCEYMNATGKVFDIIKSKLDKDTAVLVEGRTHERFISKLE